MTEAQRKASASYDRKNTKMFTIKLNYNTDANLIAWLEVQPNVQGFIKRILNSELDRLTRKEV